MKRIKINFQEIIPFLAFFVIFLFFTMTSYSERTGTYRLLTFLNLGNLLAQVMQTVIIACGSLFVVAQGHMDMSVGVNLALSGVVGVWAATDTGIAFLFLPVALIVGLAVGIFNGIIISKFKVPSFMMTLAMLIGVRGLVNYIQTKVGTHELPVPLAFMGTSTFRIITFVAILAIMAYVFEFTNAGRYSRAIGENETTAKFVGIPITKMKILAFALSGLMAGVGGIFSVATLGTTTQMMGVFFEMKVIMAIYLGGVLVTGGSSAKFYKILLGSFSIEIIINGLAISGRADPYITESVQGALLVVILILYQLASRKYIRTKALPDDVPSSKNSE